MWNLFEKTHDLCKAKCNMRAVKFTLGSDKTKQQTACGLKNHFFGLSQKIVRRVFDLFFI